MGMKANRLVVIMFITLIASCTDDNNDVTPVSDDDRDKFIGNWICNEGSGTPFTIEITKLKGDSINIKNFSGYGEHGNAKCIITDKSLNIPFQDINDLPIVVNASGTGIYSNSNNQEKITMNYTVDGTVYNNVICTK